MHRKLAFSTLGHDTLEIIPPMAGVITTLRTSTKNSVWELIDYTTYIEEFIWADGYKTSLVGRTRDNLH